MKLMVHLFVLRNLNIFVTTLVNATCECDDDTRTMVNCESDNKILNEFFFISLHKYTCTMQIIYLLFITKGGYLQHLISEKNPSIKIGAVI